MGNKEDWEDLKKIDNERKRQEISKYGLDFSNININKERKNANRVSRIVKFVNIAIIMAIIALIIIVFMILNTHYGNFTFEMSDSKIEKAMLEKYNIKAEVFGKTKNTHEHYITFKMNTKDEENIEFIAIDKNNKITDDYVARRHKYYFDLWENSSKKNFKINENISEIKYEIGANDEFLTNYEMYIDDFKDMEDAISDVKNFANFCGNNFMDEWEIYIKKGNEKIYPLRNK